MFCIFSSFILATNSNQNSQIQTYNVENEDIQKYLELKTQISELSTKSKEKKYELAEEYSPIFLHLTEIFMKLTEKKEAYLQISELVSKLDLILISLELPVPLETETRSKLNKYISELSESTFNLHEKYFGS